MRGIEVFCLPKLLCGSSSTYGASPIVVALLPFEVTHQPHVISLFCGYLQLSILSLLARKSSPKNITMGQPPKDLTMDQASKDIIMEEPYDPNRPCFINNLPYEILGQILYFAIPSVEDISLRPKPGKGPRSVAPMKAKLNTLKHAYSLSSVCSYWNYIIKDYSLVRRQLFLEPVRSNSAQMLLSKAQLTIANPIIAEPIYHQPPPYQNSSHEFKLHAYFESYIAWAVIYDLRKNHPISDAKVVIK